MRRQPLAHRSDNAMEQQPDGGASALMAKVKVASSDPAVRDMKEVCPACPRAALITELLMTPLDDHACVQFLRLVKMPHDPQACQRALLLSKRSTLQS